MAKPEEKAKSQSFSSVMDEKRKFDPPKSLTKNAYIKSMAQYKKIWKESIDDPEGFWAERAEEIDWFKKWTKVREFDFVNGNIKWFIGAKLNLTYNCLDRHLDGPRKNKAALIWEGEPVGESRIYTYQQLNREVCKFANVLKKHGIKKGDRVSIYLPMIPELAISMLACARIGAIHSIVFGGFSAEALRDRISDCQSTLLICADGYYRNGKTIANKAGADTAMAANPSIKSAIVVKRANCEVTMKEGRDLWWNDLMAAPDI